MSRRVAQDKPKVDDVVKEAEIPLREHLAKWILRLFFGTVVATYVIIFFLGFGLMHLPSAFIHWLGAATVGEVAGLLGYIIKRVF